MKGDTTHAYPSSKKGSTKHDPWSKHSLHGVAFSCQPLIIKNQEKIDKRKACNVLHSHLWGWEAKTWGRRSTPLDDPTKFFLITPHAGFKYLNLLLHYFYEFELIHNAYFLESNHKMKK